MHLNGFKINTYIFLVVNTFCRTCIEIKTTCIIRQKFLFPCLILPTQYYKIVLSLEQRDLKENLKRSCCTKSQYCFLKCKHSFSIQKWVKIHFLPLYFQVAKQTGFFAKISMTSSQSCINTFTIHIVLQYFLLSIIVVCCFVEHFSLSVLYVYTYKKFTKIGKCF